MKKKTDGKMRYYYSEEKYLPLTELIWSKKLNIIKILKDDDRSRVLLVDFQGEKLVVKEPREKNRRRWQKFLSIFRGSSSYLEYQNCKKIIELGFDGAKAILAMEKTNGFFIVDSYFVSTYIEGTEGTIEELEVISKQLEDIHKKGYLHGDSQLVNFMVGKETAEKEKKVYLIDCKLLKNKYLGFGCSYEFIYLEESCGKEIDVFSKTDIYYRGAKLLNTYLHWYGRTKKKLRGKK